jgi:hypothetical protein
MTGCCTQQIKPNKPMTLDMAVTQIRDGLAKARADCKANPSDCKSGLMVSGAEVTLSLSQSSENKLEVALPIGVPTITGGGSSTKSNSNTITLKLDNPIFATDNSAAIHCVIDKNGKLLSNRPKECWDYEVAK